MSKISVSTRKAIADVTRCKGRTILMVLGIFISVLALTGINGANDLFGKDLRSAVSSAFDVYFSYFSPDGAPPALLAKLKQTANVAIVEQRTVYSTTWHLNGHAGTTPFQVVGYPDLQHVQVGAFQLVSGRLPGPGEIAMDTSDTLYSPVALGDMVTVNRPDGQIISLRVVGLIRTVGLAVLENTAQGYMNLSELQQIAPPSQSVSTAQGPPLLKQQILIRTQNSAGNEQTFYALQPILNAYHIRQIASAYISPQSITGSQFLLQGLSIIFLGLASLALLLTCLMILTTINTMLTEQFQIIGTMKAIGATRGRIMRGYLLSIGIYALIGTALGLALGLFLCSEIASAVAQQTKVDLGPYQPSPGVILVSVVAGLIVPELVALFPLWTGTRITVHQAMASYGVQASSAGRRRAGSPRLAGFSQTVWLGLRGIFRKPVRALLTILALMLSATGFVVAQTSNNSIDVTIAQSNYAPINFEINLGSAPIPCQNLSKALRALPNVALVEPFDQEDVSIAGHRTRIFGVLPTTRLYRVHLVAGRWLDGNDPNALVISDIAAQRLNVHVGDSITMALGTRQVRWHIVGIVHDLSYASGSAEPTGRLGAMFTTLDNLDLSLRHVPAGSASQLYLNTHDQSLAALEALRGKIQQALDQAQIWQATVIYYVPGQGGGLGAAIEALFNTVAILVALVGLLALSNMLATEVLERRKEIGILRSLGATDGRISLIFWIEGLALALIAWLPGFLLALPGSAAVIGVFNAYIQPSDLAINPLVIPWTLLFIVVVSFAASFGPALRASRVRISEILRYE